MSDDATWQLLLLDLYASVTDPEAAGRLPDLISRWAGGTTAALWVTDEGRAPVEVPLTNGPAEGAALYAGHYYQHDPWAAQFFSDNTGQVIRGSRSMEDRQLDRSVFYNEFGRHFGLFHQINTTFALTGNGVPLYSTLSVLRAKGAESFSDAEIGRLQRVVPHLKQAMSLRVQMAGHVSAARGATLAAIVAGLPLAASVVDGHGRLLHANPAGEAMLEAGAWVFAKAGGERVVAARAPAARDRLSRLIAGAASGEHGGTLVLPDSAGQDMQLSATPLPMGRSHLPGWAEGLVLLVLKPAGPPNPATLRRVGIAMLGFTEAEAGVAALLAAGLSPQEIADRRGTKITTVRSLLQRAQHKAGASNLRTLVGRLTSMGG